MKKRASVELYKLFYRSYFNSINSMKVRYSGYYTLRMTEKAIYELLRAD